jgi:site-specific DNA recombinase
MRLRRAAGRRRAKTWSYLYYRCANRLYNYPLPQTCSERGINARIADAFVWHKLAELMASPELLRAQAERWIGERRERDAKTSAHAAALYTELAKLRAAESRYARAYGAGLFDIDELKAYATPVRDRIADLEKRLLEADSWRLTSTGVQTATTEQLEGFASSAAGKLHALNFEGKRAIVSRVIEKVIGSQKS